MKSRRRKSLSLRLQPYEGTPLAEVVDYLNAMDKDGANKQVSEILVMCLLPYVRKYSDHPYTAEELRMTCLEACDAMDKHASTMRQALMVEQPRFSGYYQIAPTNGYEHGNGVEVTAEVEPEAESPKSLLSGKGSSADVDALFGD